MIRPRRLSQLSKDEYQRIIQRSRCKIEEVLPSVIRIIGEIREKGDEALIEFTRIYDRVRLTAEDIKVKEREIKTAYQRVSPHLIASLRRMCRQIEYFHKHQMTKDWLIEKSLSGNREDSYRLGEKFVPVGSAAVYVPGGKAKYVSTAVMGVIPARLAGVDKIIVTSPPSSEGSVPDEIMVAADMAGANLILKAGGAQAVAALAYGTESVPRVDLVVGPGNLYVTAAKCYLASIGQVGIDCPAGPSEVLILADDSASPDYVLKDMLAQAEHDEDASSVLVTTSEKLASEVWRRMNDLLNRSSLPEITRKSLKNNGYILLAADKKEAIRFANDFAPEHLEIIIAQPEAVMEKVKNAGSIFLGPFSPVAAGDYFSGTNHILPTGGTARFFSGLSVSTFLKRISYQFLSSQALKKMEEDITTLASFEGPFTAHIDSIKARQSGFGSRRL